MKTNDIFTGDLILVNSYFPMRNEDKIDSVSVNETEIKLQRIAAESLDALMREINGWSEIVPVSGFRSLSEQQKIWNDSLKESGSDFTQKYVAKPGHSEHQTGLAIDLGKKQKHIDFIRPDFPNDGICGKFKRLAPKYGFILRYPKGKEHITKIGYEPWHFRYVGIPHAEIIEKKGLVLEEYIEFLKRNVK
ncbi:MAG: M15 family metallopeptidase [Lachnospiraceae bacterium]|nr:M15 family metallopeptidase [Ruminococcus sp.]MCM1276873.1 M15 family metallopeptidase [Lachnospiraceae bacterium]